MPELDNLVRSHFFPENYLKDETDIKNLNNGLNILKLYQFEHKPYCELFYETKLNYPTSQMIYIKSKNILCVTLDDGTVLLIDILNLLSKGEDKSRRKVFKIFHDYNYK